MNVKFVEKAVKPFSIPSEYEPYWYEGFISNARLYQATNPYNIITQQEQHKWWEIGFNDAFTLHNPMSEV